MTTDKELSTDWENVFPNYILNRDWGYLSFNPLLLPCETAIVVVEEEFKKFYILNGDFKKELESLSLDKCMNFYDSHPDLHSIWSSK